MLNLNMPPVSIISVTNGNALVAFPQSGYTTCTTAKVNADDSTQQWQCLAYFDCPGASASVAFAYITIVDGEPLALTSSSIGGNQTLLLTPFVFDENHLWNPGQALASVANPSVCLTLPGGGPTWPIGVGIQMYGWQQTCNQEWQIVTNENS